MNKNWIESERGNTTEKRGPTHSNKGSHVGRWEKMGQFFFNSWTLLSSFFCLFFWKNQLKLFPVNDLKNLHGYVSLDISKGLNVFMDTCNYGHKQSQKSLTINTIVVSVIYLFYVLNKECMPILFLEFWANICKICVNLYKII